MGFSGGGGFNSCEDVRSGVVELVPSLMAMLDFDVVVLHEQMHVNVGMRFPSCRVVARRGVWLQLFTSIVIKAMA